MGFLNATSLKKHIWEFRRSLEGSTYHIFGIAETRLSPQVDDSHVQIKGYSIIRQDRNLVGGGIALYISNSLKAKVLHSSPTTKKGKPGRPEYLFCSVWEGNCSPILVVVVYRPPDVLMRSDRRFLQLLRTCCLDYSHKVLMGDWNADMLDERKPDTRFMRGLENELSLKLINTGPSHHTESRDTWIDLLHVDVNDIVRDESRTQPTFKSRHDILSVTIELFKPAHPSSSYTFRSYNKISPEDISSHLLGCDWSAFSPPVQELDIEQGLLTLTNNVQEAIEVLAPEKTVNPAKKKVPWLNTELELLLAKRDATLRRYSRTGHRYLLEEFFNISNVAEERLEMARCAFMHNKINEVLESNKNFWKELRNLGLLPGTSDALHGFMPDELNDHFAGISISPNEDLEALHQQVNLSPSEGFSFQPVTENDVTLAVSHFKTQARGEDGIPQSVIAKSLPVILPYLTKLMNASLTRGIFPHSWKTARIIALKKVPVPSSPSDFRPIALLSFLSKVLEKLAHDQIVTFLNSNRLLDSFQTGFRKHHNTQSALLRLTDDIRMGIESKKVTLLLQFDFSKAFDTISPSRLLQKLQNIGFSRQSLQWLLTYLCGRSQCVLSKSSTSETRETNLGVPQGSVLGPLLFCLYVNDLQQSLGSDGVSRIVYADDIQVYTQVSTDNILQGIDHLSLIAGRVATWAELNHLRLNSSKTTAIAFGTPHAINLFKRLNHPGVSFPNGEIVRFEGTVKSLGILLDSTLSWRPQVDQVTSKVNRALFGLRFIKPCTTQTLRRRLVESLIVPHLDYCSVVYLNATMALRARLQRLSNAGVRYIFGVSRDTRITPYRSQLGWLRTDSRRCYFALLVMYKVVRMREPKILTSLFTPYASDKPQRGTRRDLDIPFTSSEMGINSFQVKSAKLWNSIPAHIRDLPTYSQFKRAARKYLLDLEG